MAKTPVQSPIVNPCVERLPNYGKDFLTIHDRDRLPFFKGMVLRLSQLPAVLSLAFNLLRALGLKGSWHLLQEVRQELGRASQLDWSALRQRGLSDHHLGVILSRIVFWKVLAGRLGLKKAAFLRHRFSRRFTYPVLEAVFAPPEVFAACGEGDFLPAFKQYYWAFMEAMRKVGLEEAVVVEDTPDSFQVNVVYCAWAEMAKALGNARYGYYSTCYDEELFFSEFCARAGFSFEHCGTLGQNDICCDHRFARLKPESDPSSEG